MNDLLLFLDSYRIRPGRLAEFQDAVRDITAFVEANEPQMLHYSNFIHLDGVRGTGVQIHPDYDSVKRHRVVLSERFATIMDLAEIVRIEIFGNLSERRLSQIRETAQGFGPVEVIAKDFAAGFHRLPDLTT